MIDRLKQGLESSRQQIELGLAEAQEELSSVQRRCTELEEMIRLGKAIFIAAEMQIGRGLSAVSALEAAQVRAEAERTVEPAAVEAPAEPVIPTVPVPEPEEPRVVEPALDTSVMARRSEPVASVGTSTEVVTAASTVTAVAEVPGFPTALDLAARLTGEAVTPPSAPIERAAEHEPAVQREPVVEHERAPRAERTPAEEPTLAQLLVGMESAPASADFAPTAESNDYLMADLEPVAGGSTLVEVDDAESAASRRMTSLAARLAGGHIRLTNADLERSAADLAERLRNATAARTIAS